MGLELIHSVVHECACVYYVTVCTSCQLCICFGSFCCRGLPSAIVAPAVNVADFDGDGIVDLLTLSRAAGPCHTPTVHWMGVSDGRVGVGE